MANKIVFDDGKEVELSKETTERLRKELLLNPEFVDVCFNFRISKRKSMLHPIVIGITNSGFCPEPDNNMPEKYRFVLLDKESAQETVNVLQRMINSID